MGRFRSRLDTIRQTYRLCRLGGMPEPTWLQPFLELSQGKGYDPSQGKPKRPANTRRQVYPEDRYIQSFYHRFPHARDTPVDLDSFEPPTAKKFAIRQLALLEGFDSEAKSKFRNRKKLALAARDIVEKQMLAEGELKPQKKRSVISQLQSEEERVLMAAIQQRRKDAGILEKQGDFFVPDTEETVQEPSQ